MTDDVLEQSAALRDELAANASPEPPAAPVIVDPRAVPVRFSRLRQMAASALHYWQSVQDDVDDTIAMRFGRGVHALVLGTPVKQWTGKTRQGEKWNEFAARHADKEILNTKEWDRAHGIYEAIRRHPIANAALFAGTTLEETIEWELNGRACTSRPDARRGTDLNVDLKTTKCAEPRRFSRDATYRGYHAQFAFYARAIKERFGRPPRESLCVAVETKKPFAITVLKLDDADLLEGEKCWRIWWEQLMVAEAANHWPAYTERIEPLDVASTEDVSLVIDGEDFSFDDD